MDSKIKSGLKLTILVAIISGISIFLNKFAVTEFHNSDLFTTAKNLAVGIILISGLLIFGKWQKIKLLDKTAWQNLILIAIIGGSLPFLLFFKGLSIANPGSAAFIHKTLFLWVAVLAVPFLKEKLSYLQIMALSVLILGNYFLIGPLKWHFGQGELMVFGAVILWSLETILSKKVLKKVDSEIVAGARMFLGGSLLLIYLALTHQASGLLQLNFTQFLWLIISSSLLLGYVSFWYAALKKAPATLVTSILVLASPMTTFLETIFINHKLEPLKLSAMIIISVSIVAFLYFQNYSKEKYAGSKIRS